MDAGDARLRRLGRAEDRNDSQDALPVACRKREHAVDRDGIGLRVSSRSEAC